MAASVASIRRGVRHDFCKAHRPPSRFGAWEKNVSQDPPSVDGDYLRFVRRLVKKEFPIGWDVSYGSFVDTFIPKNSARSDMSPSLESWRAEVDKRTFEAYLRGRPWPGFEEFLLRYKEVPTVGKVRPLGVPSREFDLLGPLHKSIYQFLTGKEWLLRGSPTASRISSTCIHEWQTSVDLVSATDGLSVEVTETILGALLSKATRVPGAIKVLAHESLRPRWTRGKRTGFVRHGQQMGTYLSFPLLCLQSYCMARWATRGWDSKYLVNGDDAVISSAKRVSNSDYPPFAVINDRKTARARNFVEVNSTQFLRRGGTWRKVPVLRRGVGYTDVQGVYHLATACRNAGPQWQAAFSKSALDNRILPSSFGFRLSVRDSHKREMDLFRSWYRSPPPDHPPASRFVLLEDEPCGAGADAFRRNLFEEGREGRKREAHSWANFKSVYPMSRRVPLTRPPFAETLALARLKPPVRRRKLWCHVDGFDPVVRGLPALEGGADGEEAFLVFPHR